MNDKEKLNKIKRILEKYKENHIICFNKPLWNVVQKIINICDDQGDELNERK